MPTRGKLRTADSPARHEGVAGYVLALLLLVLSYWFCAVQRTTDPNVFAFLLTLVTVAVVFRVTGLRGISQRVTWVVLASAGAATIAATLIGAEGRVLNVVLSAASIVALLVAPAAIVAHQSKRRGFNLEALLATITAYVLVGLFFTFVFNFMSLVSTTPMFDEGAVDSLSNQLFFSFTTLTTTGYGNLAPVNPGSQSVAVAEAITGQLFLITAVARIMRGSSTRTDTEPATPQETP